VSRSASGTATGLRVRVQANRLAIERPLEVVDKWLAKQQFLAGGAFSLAEISWMPYLEYVFQAGGGDVVGAGQALLELEE